VSNDLIFVALSTFAERDRAPMSLLESSGRPFRIHTTGKRITTPELLASASDAAVIIAGVEPYDVATLDGLPSLRCIARVGVGTDAIDLPAARERDIAIVNTPDVPTAAVAELALSMFLALSRNLLRQANLMHERRWERLEMHLLGARTVGIVGLGRIGRRVADLSRAFGARTIAYDPYADAGVAGAAGIELVPLERLLAESDIVSLHAARTATHPLRLDAQAFARMKNGAILVNLARGSMVDEEALHTALVSGRLGGAGLDVFGQEPYAGPLCELDNVILTPHSATMPVETRAAMELEAVDKALRFLSGKISADERVV
jgi:D-3-phosphoglycerate dehydrogenase